MCCFTYQETLGIDRVRRPLLDALDWLPLAMLSSIGSSLLVADTLCRVQPSRPERRLFADPPAIGIGRQSFDVRAGSRGRTPLMSDFPEAVVRRRHWRRCSAFATDPQSEPVRR